VVSRRAPQIGDVFSIRGTALVGRVVSTTAIVGPTHGCLLVYVYADAKRPSRDRLLLPPMLTTRAPFSHGVFEYMKSRPLLPGDYFERHAFRDAQGNVYDEEARPLPSTSVPDAPVGEWALQPADAIERAVATALSSSTTRRRTSRSSPPRKGPRKRTPPSRSR
jgi:hypothetical protein